MALHMKRNRSGNLNTDTLQNNFKKGKDEIGYIEYHQ